MTRPKSVLLGGEFFDSSDSDIVWELSFTGQSYGGVKGFFQCSFPNEHVRDVHQIFICLNQIFKWRLLTVEACSGGHHFLYNISDVGYEIETVAFRVDEVMNSPVLEAVVMFVCMQNLSLKGSHCKDYAENQKLYLGFMYVSQKSVWFPKCTR
ncbi:Phosphatidylglycerol/phosphatidylinositol transfer protein [Trichinella pseudospiralis]